MRKFLSALLMASCFVSPAFALDVWGIYDDKTQKVCHDVDLNSEIDLPQVMEKAICANPSLKISYFSTLISGSSYGQGLSSYLPDVSATGSVSSSDRKIDGGSSTQSSDASASVRLSWLLLDMGGRSASADRLKAYLESSYLMYDDTLQTVLFDVVSAYYAVLSAEEKYEGLLKSEESYKKSYEEANSRYQLGLVPLSDKLQAQTSYDQARLACNVARKNIAIERGNLANLLDVSPDIHFKLVRPDKNVEDNGKVDAFDKLVAKALENRSDFKANQQELIAAEKQITVAKSEALPYLSGDASASADKDIRDGNRAQYGASAGLTLTVPLFTGFSNSYKIGQAKYQYEQAKETLEQSKNKIENEVWAAVQDYQTSLESFKISKSLLASAKENEKVAFASYKVGKVNILTLLDAESSLASARVENSTTFYNFLTAKAKLQRVLGETERTK